MADETNDAPVTVEQCVMVCPQCEGEGGYADGLDDAACHTDCTRCGGNGWIVDLAALASAPAGDGVEDVRAANPIAKNDCPSCHGLGTVLIQSGFVLCRVPGCPAVARGLNR